MHCTCEPSYLSAHNFGVLWPCLVIFGGLESFWPEEHSNSQQSIHQWIQMTSATAQFGASKPELWASNSNYLVFLKSHPSSLKAFWQKEFSGQRNTAIASRSTWPAPQCNLALQINRYECPTQYICSDFKKNHARSLKAFWHFNTYILPFNRPILQRDRRVVRGQSKHCTLVQIYLYHGCQRVKQQLVFPSGAQSKIRWTSRELFFIYF